MSTNRKFKIKTLTDNIYDFDVSESMTISELKVLIAERTNVPVERQRLVFMAKLLDNEQTIGNYLKEDNLTIHLMAKVVEPEQGSGAQRGAEGNQQQQQQQQQQQHHPQQQGNNPLAGMFGNLSNLFGFDPMALIQQVTTQPQGNGANGRAPNVVQAGQNPPPPLGGNPFFGGFVMPGNPINLQVPPTGNSTQQSQQQQQQPAFSIFSPPIPPPPQAQQQQQQSSPNVLPFNTLQSLGLSINEMMGPGATFPGPPLPPVQNRNSVQILGAYLSQWHFQMSRLLPFINRLGELLQREPLLVNQNDRSLAQQMVNRVPALFETVSNATRNVVQHYSNLRLGNAPGQFTLGNQNNQNQGQNQGQGHNQGQANSNNFGGVIGQPVVSVQILSDGQLPPGLGPLSNLFGGLMQPNNNNAGNNPNPPNNPNTSNTSSASNNPNPNPNPNPNTNTNTNSTSPPPNQNNMLNNLTSSLNTILPNIQGLLGNFVSGLGPMGSPPPQQQSPQRTQSQPQPSTVPQSQSTPTPQPQPSTTSTQQPSNPQQSPPPTNPLNALQGFMSNSNISSMLTPENISMATNSNLRYMISQGQVISPQNESIYSLIFGDITGGQLIALFTSSNYSFFDNRRADFRRGIQTALGRYENSREALAERITSDILPLLVSQELSAASIEGFDAELVAREILSKHSLTLINLILDDQPDFSNRLIKQIRLMIGELIYQLQEGSTKDVQFIVSCIKSSGARVMDPYLMGMSGLVFMLFDRGMYTSYQEFKQAKERGEKMTQEDHDNERNLLERIEKQSEEDKDQLEKFVRGEKSQYFK